MFTPSDSLHPIRKALKAGRRKSAQRSLRVLLRREPTAEAWVLAAQACGSRDEALYCLQHALALQPEHGLAKKLLFRLENASPSGIPFRQNFPQTPAAPFRYDFPQTPAVPFRQIPTDATRSRQRHPGRRVIIISVLMLLAVISIITLNLAGLISGPVTAMTELTGGGSPVREINGTPISQAENAPLFVQPSQTRALQTQDIDVIEPGYAHDFTFVAEAGKDVAIYVQFLSVAANRVSRNVVLIRPDGSDATPTCDRDAILDGDNGVTFTCSIDVDGTWIIRVLGREKESVGAYFIGEQAMN